MNWCFWLVITGQTIAILCLYFQCRYIERRENSRQYRTDHKIYKLRSCLGICAGRTNVITKHLNIPVPSVEEMAGWSNESEE